MKLMNFRRLDPNYKGQGKSGLENGSRSDEEVWNEFGSPSDRKRLSSAAKAILSTISYKDYRRADGMPDVPDDQIVEPDYDLIDGELVEIMPQPGSAVGRVPPEAQPSEIEPYLEEAPEGALLTRSHTVRERNKQLIADKKRQAEKEAGELRCEACSMSFYDTYGEFGLGFIEVHHTVPLYEYRKGDKTKLDDLALLCANCHRMIHWKRHSWLTVEQLREMITSASDAR